jgi:site-specific recombinase XerC
LLLPAPKSPKPTLTSSPPRSGTGTLELLTRGLAGSFLIGAPLTAYRYLWGWRVNSIPDNGVDRKYVDPVGKQFDAEEARALLDSIDISTLTGLRDRALIGVMVYTFPA